MRWKTANVASGAAALMLVGSVCQAATDEVAELRTLVSELRREVQALRAGSGDGWLTEQRAAEIRGLVHDVLADADTRFSLQGSGMAAGWDNGFFLGSADGNFRLKIGGQIQFRYVYNTQDNSPVDDHRSGFEMRRTRLLLSGHVIDPTWQYDIQMAADRGTGTFALEDAGWIQKDLGDGWKVRVGQMKAPFLREETLSSIRMMAVERTLINSQFTAGTVQGVQLGWERDRFRAYGMYHDGNRSANTAWNVEDTEYALSGRVEWLAAGEWKNLIDYVSFRDEGENIIIGAAVNYSMQEFGTGNNLPAPDFNNAEVENLGLTVDATADLGGINLAGAFVYRNLQTNAGAADTDLDQLGLLLHAGVFVTDDIELYGQYEWGDLDTADVEDLSVVTLGVAKYWNKHNLKWQTDVGYGINEIDAPWASDSSGWRTDGDDEDGQVVLRSQIQLVF